MFGGMIAKVSAAAVVVLAGIAAYFKFQLQNKEIELKDIEKDSAQEAVRFLTDAQQADHDAIQEHKRRSTDEINRAKSGNRDFFS